MIIEWVVEPHLGRYAPPNGSDVPDMPRAVAAVELRGLRRAGRAALIYAGLVIWMAVPFDSQVSH